MFEHLDDPAPYRPDPALRGVVLAEGRRRQRRRRRRRRWTGAVGGSALIVLAVVAGAVLYVGQRVSQVQKVEVAGLPAAQPARGEPSTVLFVGVDSDAGLPADAPGTVGS